MFKKKQSATSPSPSETPGGKTSAAPGRKLVLILGLVLVSLLALGGGLVAAIGPARLMALMVPDTAPEIPQDIVVTPEGTDPEALPPGADLVAMPFDEMIVNITAQTESGRQTSRFLKMDLSLVYDRQQDTAGVVEARHIFLRDAFQDYLRQLADRDLEGTHGLVTVKGELLRRARAISGSDAPREIVMTGMVIQ